VIGERTSCSDLKEFDPTKHSDPAVQLYQKFVSVTLMFDVELKQELDLLRELAFQPFKTQDFSSPTS